MTDASTRGASADRPRAHPPETTEGWYAFPQILAFDRPALRGIDATDRARIRIEAEAALDAASAPAVGGWSAVVPLVGSRADVMLVHFRPTFDGIGDVQRSLARVELLDYLRPVYTFLSVTEAGLYHASAQVAADGAARGGVVGDATPRCGCGRARRCGGRRDASHGDGCARRRRGGGLARAAPALPAVPARDAV